jgi:hypothetical protein
MSAHPDETRQIPTGQRARHCELRINETCGSGNDLARQDDRVVTDGMNPESRFPLRRRIA